MASKEGGDRNGQGTDEGKDTTSWERFLNAVRGNWRLAFTLLLLFLIAFLYLWKDIAVELVKEDMRIQRGLLVEKAEKALREKDRTLLRLTAIPLSWAVGADLADGNLGRINRYFVHLVKEGRFRVILLAGNDGTVIVSTDKGMEGFPVDRFYPGSVLNLDETGVRLLPDGSIMAVAPVMGVAGKEGVLLLVSLPETASFDATGGDHAGPGMPRGE